MWWVCASCTMVLWNDEWRDVQEHYHYVCQMLNILLGVPNVKYLAFGTTNTKNQSSSGISNLKNFGMKLQYNLKCETVQTSMSTIFLLISFTFSLFSQYLSLSPSATHISLSLRLVLSSPSLFLFHHTTPFSPRHWPPHHAAELRTITRRRAFVPSPHRAIHHVIESLSIGL